MAFSFDVKQMTELTIKGFNNAQTVLVASLCLYINCCFSQKM